MFILLKTGLIVLSVTYCSVFTGVCFCFEYNLYLNLVDLMISRVIQGDFLCLCLLNFLILIGKYFCVALVIVYSKRL